MKFTISYNLLSVSFSGFIAFGTDVNQSNTCQEAFEEGGVLHGKKVYLFGSTERMFVDLPFSSRIYFFVIFFLVESICISFLEKKKHIYCTERSLYCAMLAQ